MKTNENLKVAALVVLFFTIIILISFYTTKPIEPKTPSVDKQIQLAKDSITNQIIKQELDSTYPFDHSKTPTDDSKSVR